MKDAAILTKFYKNYNYGGMLQGYALKKAVTDLGYSVDLVSYDVGANPNPVYPGLRQQIRQYGMLSAAEKAGEKAIGKCRFMISDLLAERIRLFERFMKDTGVSTEVYDDLSAERLPERYKAFISGSDQIWNPNAVRNLYLQTFVSEPERKISYAASIGRDSFSEREAAVLIPALKKFGSLSVREKTAKALLESYLDNPVVTSLDPTMLLDREEWDKAASGPVISGKYALVYFFSDSLQVRRKAAAFCRRHGLRMVFIPYAKQEYNLTDAAGPGLRIAKAGPAEFVSLISGAQFVLTDSFHGAVFSIIYRKPFAVFERNKSGHVSMNSRLYDLLALFDQSHRLIDASRIDELEALYAVDEDKISAIMDREKRKSLGYLREALYHAVKAYDASEPGTRVNADEARCTGCSACEAVCPAGCITMSRNRNGFAAPVIDEEKCVHCGRCIRTCPVQGRLLQMHTPTVCLGAYAVTEDRASASGGIGGILVKRWTEQGDPAYGSIYDDKLRVMVERADSPEQAEAFRGSKYVQSDMNSAVRRVIDDLKAGRKVLFTGTPCQIAGVRAAVQEMCPGAADSLYTAEIICHGTPSPKMFESYLEWIWERHGQRAVSYRFRSREEEAGTGFDRDFMVTIGMENGGRVSLSGFRDPYYRLFMSSKWFRKSCYRCAFSQRERAADLTMGDFWNTEKLPDPFGKNRRVSVVLINTRRGEKLLDLISGDIRMTGTDWNTAAEGNPNLQRPTRIFGTSKEFGDVTDPGLLFDRESSQKVNSGKYWFNQLSPEMRRAVKKGIRHLRPRK